MTITLAYANARAIFNIQRENHERLVKQWEEETRRWREQMFGSTSNGSSTSNTSNSTSSTTSTSNTSTSTSTSTYSTSTGSNITVLAPIRYVSGTFSSDRIYNPLKDYVTISAGAGNDTINNYVGWNNRIYAGDGNDSIINASGHRTTIDGGSGSDTIRTSGSNVSISGGTGNDLISLNSASSANNTIAYANGDENDKVYGFGSDDVFNITSNTNYSTRRSGSNLIVTVGSGVVTLYGSSSSQTFTIRKTSRNIVEDSNYFSDEVGSSENVIVGSTSDDVFTANSTSSTLWGRGGNDALIGGSSADTFKYTAEDGNVTIQNGDSNDVVDISSYSIDDVSSNFTNTGLVISAGANHSLNITGSDLTQIQFADGMHTANYNQRRLI